MAFSDDVRLLIKIARLYYEEGATQAEIGKVLGISRSLVSKSLIVAREMGIVKVTIKEELADSNIVLLEKEIEKKYGLREVVIVSESRDLGLAASNYFLRIAKNDQIIGVTSGVAISQVAAAMPKSPHPSLTIVPLVGGIGDQQVDNHANQITVQMAEKLGADFKLLYAPVLVDSADAKEIFLRQSLISEVFALAERCDIAFVGIGGTPESSTIVKSLINGGDTRKELLDADVVGVVCNKFINSTGQEASISWNSRAISVSLETLKKIPIVIGVVHGNHKISAIHSALSGNLINVLVTDVPTAEGLMELGE